MIADESGRLDEAMICACKTVVSRLCSELALDGRRAACGEETWRRAFDSNGMLMLALLTAALLRRARSASAYGALWSSSGSDKGCEYEAPDELLLGLRLS